MTNHQKPFVKPFAIFDLDGTLIDSMPYWEKLAPEYLKKQGITGDLQGIVSDIETMTLSESADFFVRRFQLNETAKKAEADMLTMMADHYRYDIPLKPGMRDLLRTLTVCGVAMCVVSVTEETLMNACLKRLGIFDMFKFTLSCETYHTHKRDPWIYLKASEMLGAKPTEIAVYEDTFHALKTAKNAGFYTVAVYDYSSEKNWHDMICLADGRIKNTDDQERDER